MTQTTYTNTHAQYKHIQDELILITFRTTATATQLNNLRQALAHTAQPGRETRPTAVSIS
jgi:hypothetical protein